ncbi:hypothetical protein Emag_006355 [Eimeria magna]
MRVGSKGEKADKVRLLAAHRACKGSNFGSSKLSSRCGSNNPHRGDWRAEKQTFQISLRCVLLTQKRSEATASGEKSSSNRSKRYEGQRQRQERAIIAENSGRAPSTPREQQTAAASPSGCIGATETAAGEGFYFCSLEDSVTSLSILDDENGLLSNVSSCSENDNCYSRGLPRTELQSVYFGAADLATPAEGNYRTHTARGSEAADTSEGPYVRPTQANGASDIRVPATAIAGDGLATAGVAADFAETSGACEAAPNATVPGTVRPIPKADCLPDVSLADAGCLRQALQVIGGAQVRALAEATAGAPANANTFGLVHSATAAKASCSKKTAAKTETSLFASLFLCSMRSRNGCNPWRQQQQTLLACGREEVADIQVYGDLRRVAVKVGKVAGCSVTTLYRPVNAVLAPAAAHDASPELAVATSGAAEREWSLEQQVLQRQQQPLRLWVLERPACAQRAVVECFPLSISGKSAGSAEERHLFDVPASASEIWLTAAARGVAFVYVRPRSVHQKRYLPQHQQQQQHVRAGAGAHLLFSLSAWGGGKAHPVPLFCCASCVRGSTNNKVDNNTSIISKSDGNARRKSSSTGSSDCSCSCCSGGHAPRAVMLFVNPDNSNSSSSSYSRCSSGSASSRSEADLILLGVIAELPLVIAFASATQRLLLLLLLPLDKKTGSARGRQQQQQSCDEMDSVLERRLQRKQHPHGQWQQPQQQQPPLLKQREEKHQREPLQKRGEEPPYQLRQIASYEYEPAAASPDAFATTATAAAGADSSTVPALQEEQSSGHLLALLMLPYGGPHALEKRLVVMVLTQWSHELVLLPLPTCNCGNSNYSNSSSWCASKSSVSGVVAFCCLKSTADTAAAAFLPVSDAVARSGRVDGSPLLSVCIPVQRQQQRLQQSQCSSCCSFILTQNEIPQHFVSLHLDGLLRLYFGNLLLQQLLFVHPEGVLLPHAWPLAIGSPAGNTFRITLLMPPQQQPHQHPLSRVKTFRCRVRLEPSSWLLRACMQSFAALLQPEATAKLLPVVFRFCQSPAVLHLLQQPQQHQQQEHQQQQHQPKEQDKRQQQQQHLVMQAGEAAEPPSCAALEWNAFCLFLCHEATLSCSSGHSSRSSSSSPDNVSRCASSSCKCRCCSKHTSHVVEGIDLLQRQTNLLSPSENAAQNLQQQQQHQQKQHQPLRRSPSVASDEPTATAGLIASASAARKRRRRLSQPLQRPGACCYSDAATASAATPSIATAAATAVATAAAVEMLEVRELEPLGAILCGTHKAVTSLPILQQQQEQHQSKRLQQQHSIASPTCIFGVAARESLCFHRKSATAASATETSAVAASLETAAAAANIHCRRRVVLPPHLGLRKQLPALFLVLHLLLEDLVLRQVSAQLEVQQLALLLQALARRLGLPLFVSYYQCYFGAALQQQATSGGGGSASGGCGTEGVDCSHAFRCRGVAAAGGGGPRLSSTIAVASCCNICEPPLLVWMRSLQEVPSALTLLQQLAATGPLQKQQHARLSVASIALRRLDGKQHIEAETLGLQQQLTPHRSIGSSCDSSNTGEALSAARMIKNRISQDPLQKPRQQGIVVFPSLLMPLTSFAAFAVAAAHGSEVQQLFDGFVSPDGPFQRGDMQQRQKEEQKQQQQQQQGENSLWRILRLSTEVGVDTGMLGHLLLPLRLWLLEAYRHLSALDDLLQRGLTQQQLLLLRRADVAANQLLLRGMNHQFDVACTKATSYNAALAASATAEDLPTRALFAYGDQEVVYAVQKVYDSTGKSNSNGSGIMLNLAGQLLCCTTPCETRVLLESAAAAAAAVPEDMLRLRQQQALQRRLSVPLGRGAFSLGCVDPDLYVFRRSTIPSLELRCQIVTVAPLQGQQHQKRKHEQQQAPEFTWDPLDEETKDLQFEPRRFCAVGGAPGFAAAPQETARLQDGNAGATGTGPCIGYVYVHSPVVQQRLPVRVTADGLEWPFFNNACAAALGVRPHPRRAAAAAAAARGSNNSLFNSARSSTYCQFVENCCRRRWCRSIGASQQQQGHHQRERKSSAFLQWLSRQRRFLTPAEFGGLCLGLSLQGRLHQLDEKDWVQLLQGGQGDNSAPLLSGLLLAACCSHIGSCSSPLRRFCMLHLPAAPALAASLGGGGVNSSSKAECAALVGLGLLYFGTGHKALTETILQYLLRTPWQQQQQLANDPQQQQERCAYALSAAWALGALWAGRLSSRACLIECSSSKQVKMWTNQLMMLANLTLARAWEKHGPSASSEGATKLCPVHRSLLLVSAAAAAGAGDTCAGKNSHPLVLNEEHARLLLAPWGEGPHRQQPLQPCSSGSTRYRSNAHAGVIDAALLAGPAAVALGLFHFNSNDEETARKLLLPTSKQEVEECLCESVAHKVLARCLIRFTSIKASHKWIVSQLPPILRILPSDACSTAGVGTFAEGRQGRLTGSHCMPYAHLIGRNTGMLIPNRIMLSHCISRSCCSSNRSDTSSSSSDTSNLNLYKASLLRAHCIAAVLWVLGLRYAGSNDSAVVLLLLQYYSVYASARLACTEHRPLHDTQQQQGQEQHEMIWIPSMAIRSPQLQQAVGLDPSAANVVLRCCCCGLACVAAGTGRQDVLSVLLRERHRLSTGGNGIGRAYADQLLLHHCIGLLFLGGCRWSLQRSNSLAVAALLLSLQPLSTAGSTAVCASKLPGQAERQLYVLAAEPRYLRAVEASTGMPAQVPVELLLRSSFSSSLDNNKAAAGSQAYVHRICLPAVLPAAANIVNLRIASRNFWPFTVSNCTRYCRSHCRADNSCRGCSSCSCQLERLLAGGVLVVQRRTRCLPQRLMPQECMQQQQQVQYDPQKQLLALQLHLLLQNLTSPKRRDAQSQHWSAATAECTETAPQQQVAISHIFQTPPTAGAASARAYASPSWQRQEVADQWGWTLPQVLMHAEGMGDLSVPSFSSEAGLLPGHRQQLHQLGQQPNNGLFSLLFRHGKASAATAVTLHAHGQASQRRVQQGLSALLRVVAKEDKSLRAAELLLSQECLAEDKLFALPFLQQIHAFGAGLATPAKATTANKYFLIAAGFASAQKLYALEPFQLRCLRLSLQLWLHSLASSHATWSCRDNRFSSSNSSTSKTSTATTSVGAACSEIPKPLVSRSILLRCSKKAGDALKAEGAARWAFWAYTAVCLHAAAASASAMDVPEASRQQRVQHRLMLLQACEYRQLLSGTTTAELVQQCMNCVGPCKMVSSHSCFCQQQLQQQQHIQQMHIQQQHMLLQLLRKRMIRMATAYRVHHCLPLATAWVRHVEGQLPLLLHLLQEHWQQQRPHQQLYHQPCPALVAGVSTIARSAAPWASAEGQVLLESVLRHFCCNLLQLKGEAELIPSYS